MKEHFFLRGDIVLNGISVRRLRKIFMPSMVHGRATKGSQGMDLSKLYKPGSGKKGADKLMEALERNAHFEKSTADKMEAYRKWKERKVLVDGELRNPDDLDGKKEAARRRREERTRIVGWILGGLIFIAAIGLCVLSSKGINPLDNLYIDSESSGLSKLFHYLHGNRM